MSHTEEPTGEHRPIEPEVLGQSFGNQGVSTDSTAIAAFVLAICSWFVLPVVGAIAALVLIPSARARIKASGGTVEGHTLIVFTRILAWLNLLVAAALIGVLVLAGAAIFSIFS